VVPSSALAKDLDQVFYGQYKNKKTGPGQGKYLAHVEPNQQLMSSIVDESGQGADYFEQIEKNKQASNLYEINSMRESMQ
jgi:hypothetical protein